MKDVIPLLLTVRLLLLLEAPTSAIVAFPLSPGTLDPTTAILTLPDLTYPWHQQTIAKDMYNRQAYLLGSTAAKFVSKERPCTWLLAARLDSITLTSFGID
jgi:hypothetical protein